MATNNNNNNKREKQTKCLFKGGKSTEKYKVGMEKGSVQFYTVIREGLAQKYKRRSKRG